MSWALNSFDGFDFLPQPRERSLPHGAQHLGVAPFTPAPARSELAVDGAAHRQQAHERGLDNRGAEAETGADVACGEWSVRAAEAADQIGHRIGNRLEQRVGKTRRQRHADGVAVTSRVFHRDEAFVAGDANGQQPSRFQQLVERWCGDTRVAPHLDFGPRQIPEAE